MDVLKSQEYLSLPAEEVKKLLSSDMLNVHSEEESYESLITWVNYDIVNREKELSSLLEMIRLPLISPQVLYTVLQYPNISHSNTMSCIFSLGSLADFLIF